MTSKTDEIKDGGSAGKQHDRNSANNWFSWTLLCASVGFTALLLWLVIESIYRFGPNRSILLTSAAIIGIALSLWLIVSSVGKSLQNPQDRQMRVDALGATLLSTLVLIGSFAAIYAQEGLLYSVTEEVYNNWGDVRLSHPLKEEVDVPTYSFSTSLYFSIITITSVGYGDFRPVEAVRGVAAVEALIGYFVFGLITAFLVSLIGTPQPDQRALAPNQSIATAPDLDDC